ncbi:MAG: HEAT repeat domain-containing protein [Planctomycetaceae bacterium]
MSTTKFLPYRGELKAITGDAGLLLFVVAHLEGLATSVYRLDCESLKLSETPLPCGAVAVDGSAAESWIAGTDSRLYSLTDQQPVDWGIDFPQPPTHVITLDDNRIAVLAGTELVIVNRKKKKTELQRIELPDSGTAIAADPSGQWLVVGTKSGRVAVYQSEEQNEFVLSEDDKLHEGAVTALLFEPEELRFLSAGIDQKLLLTHARGKLEPEDRGRGGGHADRVTALVHVPGDRFVSGSADKSLKTWSRSGGTRPATLTDGVLSVIDLALVEIHKRPHIVAACGDNSLRFWLLDAGGRFGQLVYTVRDAYANAEEELSQNDVSRRQAALKQLAAFNDAASLNLISQQIDRDDDHGQRLLATELLGAADHPKVVNLLEPRLKHREEGVRLAAFAGLRKQLGDADLRPLDLALKAKQKDIGIAAVQALQKLADKDDLALARLVSAMETDPYPVRFAAMTALEAQYGKDDPAANLKALLTGHADLREAALVRLLQRKLLATPLVQTALRRHLEDEQASVRRTAFLVSLLNGADLSTAIRTRDKDLHRQMFELETRTLEEKSAASDKQKELPRTRKAKANLTDADFEPLLQAMATRSVDICLLGTRCLALLEDPRAFGVLLQLSREPDAAARVDVCRAFGALKDVRSVNRLRTLMYDSETQVRDAAFSALAAVYDNEPLTAAEAGLGVNFDDVQRRGLQLLVKQLKSDAPESADEVGWQLMCRALNSEFHAVRIEAFKSALNLNLGGGGADTLRFVLNSEHADVRSEVLTEVMGQPREDWAWTLLQELFADPDSGLRAEAFDFAIKFTKGRDLAPVRVAAESPFVDIRIAAIAQLVRRPSAEARDALLLLIDDEDKSVRLKALEGLVHAEKKEPIQRALESRHKDIRISAATTLAYSGDAAVLPVLMEIVQEDEPEPQAEKDAWKTNVTTALWGLAELQDEQSFEAVRPLLKSAHAKIRAEAANVMAATCSSETVDVLKEILRHEDAKVKQAAAFGLAVLGDPIGASLLFEKPKEGFELQPLAAAMCLGPLGHDRLLTLLDSETDVQRQVAMFLLLAKDVFDHNGTPASGIACLSAEHPRIRLKAAEAVQQFGDPAAQLSGLTSLFNDRGDEAPWQVSEDVVRTICHLALFANPHVRARTILLLEEWKPGVIDAKQDEWDHPWRVHSQRFADQIAAIEKAQSKSKLPKPTVDETQTRQLAFGTFVGVLREPLRDKNERNSSWVIALRLAAIKRLTQLAVVDPGFQAMIQPVLIQTLGYPNRVVHMEAFNRLQSLNVDPATLAAEAIESGWSDLGAAGLDLLTKGASAAATKTILEQCMLTRTDELASKAAELLIERTDVVDVARKACDAASEKLRLESVRWLTAAYDDNTKAKTLLQEMLTSRHEEVRWEAAQNLATKNDEAALDAIIERLQDADKKRQVKVIEVITRLSNPKVPTALIARVANDPSETAQVNPLLVAAGKYRLPENADKLLTMMENAKWRTAAGNAVLTISGFDQPVMDCEEERVDRTWEEEQHLRHSDVLAKLLHCWMEINDVPQLKKLVHCARWARGSDVDDVMTILASHADAELRVRIIEAIGWRVLKRGASADVLVNLLDHKDPNTKLAAAHALAINGRSEGISVLLAAVDLMSDLSQRQAAVRALGQLADERALNILLKMASDDEHALQEEAIEAIGHMGRSDQADEIFSLLKAFATGVPSPTSWPGLNFEQDGLRGRAIRGLRWFNSRDGWQLIREQAAIELPSDAVYDADWQVDAVEMLGYDDDDATKELLLKIIRSSPSRQRRTAVDSARRVFGEESLEPDYAYLMSEDAFFGLAIYLERVQNGDPQRIFEVLEDCDHCVFVPLATQLLQLENPPVDAALFALDGNKPATVGVAAKILGQATGAETRGDVIAATIDKWLPEWIRLRESNGTDCWMDPDVYDSIAAKWDRDHAPKYLQFADIAACLKRLFWAAGRLQTAESQLITAAGSRTDDKLFRPLRLAALRALAESKPGKPALAVLQDSLTDQDVEIRQVATSLLATHDLKRLEKLAPELLSDRPSFERLARAGATIDKALAASVGDNHYQGVVLPHLVKNGSEKILAAAAEDQKLPENNRLGAIEALARISSDEAENVLAKLGQSDQTVEELRRAAWSGLRRSKRFRERQAAKQETSG